MKLKDFLELNAQIGDLILDVRDYSQGGGRLMKSYHIGLDAREDRFPDPTGARWETICQAINYRDKGETYFGSILNPIPKSLLEMEIYCFHIYQGRRVGSLNNPLYKLSISLVGKAKDFDQLQNEERLKAMSKDIDENGQLIGQMSFEV